MRGHFQGISDIQEQLLTILLVISKSQYQQCFLQWCKDWTHSINLEGTTTKWTTTTSNEKKHIFRLSPATFGYAL